jgi:hypothetical protein
MSDINQRIEVFAEIGSFLKQFAADAQTNHHLNNTFWEPMQAAIVRSKAENGWFTEDNVRNALAAWGNELTRKKLGEWVNRYAFTEPKAPKNVAIIMAGNIPLVGFHDFLTVLLFGHAAVVKLSADDKRLLPLIAKMLVELHPYFEKRIRFVERVVNPAAVIATGSNNTARYFAYYFGKYPNIIRKNRTSVAVLTGDETEAQITALGEDIFRYFGMGCRNVGKVYIPLGFDLNRIFAAILPFAEVVQNHKYANNYDYHRAIFMLNKQPFLENGFVIFKEGESLHTPVSVIHYERYADLEILNQQLLAQAEELQCVVGNAPGHIPFGKTQCPTLWDYADGVDTVAFLLRLG